MKRRILLLFLFIYFPLFAQDTSQTFLSLKPTGVEEFLNRNPRFDGRGTLIFILDTGVDMGIDGLKTTPSGETKVVDVRDFTGQGDLPIFEADIDNEDNSTYAINKEHNLSVKGLETLALKPVDGKYYIGNFDEARFLNSNSGVKDLNGNGTTNDNFIVVCFKTAGSDGTHWVAYFDVNGNGSLSDDKPMRSYHEKFDTFQIPVAGRIPFFTFAFNIFPDEKKINVFYDDGGHGTHVAGIAAGFRIGKEKHFNGVAIGAKVIALKIGHNTNSGGATISESMKNAYLYADQVSRSVKEPCIINMSFTNGCGFEANSDIELFLQDLLRKNPYLYVCVSNGNNGPGLSSSGNPSTCKYVFSSGAILTKEVGRDLYGASLTEDIILHFSSRGGETSKPDIVAPGACASTVTNWAGGDRMWGTSMASPYTAGVISLLLSAAEQTFPGIRIPSQFLFKAVKAGAVKMEGYNFTDQGAGYINVVNAFDKLKEFIKTKQLESFEDYTVSTFCPGGFNDKAPNIYFRNGSVFSENDVFNFNISRVNGSDSSKFYRVFNLQSDSPWLLPVQKKTYLRNTQDNVVSVRFDKSKMTAPGLYTGSITAFRQDNPQAAEFQMNACVIIPFEFNKENQYSRNWNNETLMPGRHKRYFINIPAGSSSMTIQLGFDKGKYTQALYRLFNPDGEMVYTSPLVNSSAKDNGTVKSHNDLKPGVYEIIVHAYYLAKEISSYNLSVEFGGVKSIPENVVISDKPVPVVNLFSQIKNYELSGSVLGYSSDFTVAFKGTDHLSHPFVLHKNESSKEFAVKVSRLDFNKFTDFSMLIYDEKGKAIVKGGLSFPEGSISVANTFGDADSTNLVLEIVPAFADKPGDAVVNITELTSMNPLQVSVYSGKSSHVDLYPGIEQPLNFLYTAPSGFLPRDSHYYGRIYFKSMKTDKIELEIPFLLK